MVWVAVHFQTYLTDVLFSMLEKLQLSVLDINKLLTQASHLREQCAIAKETGNPFSNFSFFCYFIFFNLIMLPVVLFWFWIFR